MSKQALKNSVAQVVKTNSVNSITGANLQAKLFEMIDAMYPTATGAQTIRVPADDTLLDQHKEYLTMAKVVFLVPEPEEIEGIAFTAVLSDTETVNLAGTLGNYDILLPDFAPLVPTLQKWRITMASRPESTDFVRVLRSDSADAITQFNNTLNDDYDVRYHYSKDMYDSMLAYFALYGIVTNVTRGRVDEFNFRGLVYSGGSLNDIVTTYNGTLANGTVNEYHFYKIEIIANGFVALDVPDALDYTHGEQVIGQTSGATGTVYFRDNGSGIRIHTVTGTFTGGETINGVSSGASKTLVSATVSTNDVAKSNYNAGQTGYDAPDNELWHDDLSLELLSLTEQIVLGSLTFLASTGHNIGDVWTLENNEGAITFNITNVTGTFQVGETVTGNNSTQIGYIMAVNGSTITLRTLIVGLPPYEYNELIQGNLSGATANILKPENKPYFGDCGFDFAVHFNDQQPAYALQSNISGGSSSFNFSTLVPYDVSGLSKYQYADKIRQDIIADATYLEVATWDNNYISKPIITARQLFSVAEQPIGTAGGYLFEDIKFFDRNTNDYMLAILEAVQNANFTEVYQQANGFIQNTNIHINVKSASIPTLDVNWSSISNPLTPNIGEKFTFQTNEPATIGSVGERVTAQVLGTLLDIETVLGVRYAIIDVSFMQTLKYCTIANGATFSLPYTLTLRSLPYFIPWRSGTVIDLFGFSQNGGSGVSYDYSFFQYLTLINGLFLCANLEQGKITIQDIKCTRMSIFGSENTSLEAGTPIHH